MENQKRKNVNCMPKWLSISSTIILVGLFIAEVVLKQYNAFYSEVCERAFYLANFVYWGIYGAFEKGNKLGRFAYFIIAGLFLISTVVFFLDMF